MERDYALTLVGNINGGKLVNQLKVLRATHPSWYRPEIHEPNAIADYTLFDFCCTRSDKIRFTNENPSPVLYFYKVMTITGPAGSGKSFLSVTNIAPNLGNVLITGTTNNAADIMINLYKQVEVAQYGGTIYRHMRFKKTYQCISHKYSDPPKSFKENQLRNLLYFWPTVQQIKRDFESQSNRNRYRNKTVKELIHGDETVAHILRNAHPTLVPELALADYIFIDECSQAGGHLLDAIAFIRCHMRTVLGLPNKQPVVFVLIGSPTQTSAHKTIVKDHTKSVQVVTRSIIDEMYCNKICRNDLGIMKHSVRCLKIKRTDDEEYNRLMYKMEHGDDLWSERLYFDKLVTDPQFIVNPQHRFYPERLRVFLSHKEVQTYITRALDVDRNNDLLIIPIFCIISINDTERYFNLYLEDILIEQLKKYLAKANISDYSQFIDNLGSTSWEYVASRNMIDDHVQYEPPNRKRNRNFFDSQIADFPLGADEMDVDDDHHEFVSTEKKRIALFKNTLKFKKGVRAIIQRTTHTLVVGFEGNISNLVSTLQTSQFLIKQSRFYFRCGQILCRELCFHSSQCVDCKPHEIELESLFAGFCALSAWSSPLRDIEIANGQLVLDLLNEYSHMSRCSLYDETLHTIYVNDNGPNDTWETLTLDRVFVKTFIGGNACQVLGAYPFPEHLHSHRKVQQCFSMYKACTETFPEISHQTLYLRSLTDGLLCLTIPNPSFKWEEDGNELCYHISVTYNTGITNCLAMTAAKSTGSSLEGVCCYFPKPQEVQKLKSVRQAVYVMMTRSRDSKNVNINYNIFRHKGLLKNNDLSQNIINRVIRGGEEGVWFV